MLDKCENCIHYEVCRFRPALNDEPEIKRIVMENCEDFISDKKIVDPKSLMLDLKTDIEAYAYNGADLDVCKWLENYLKRFYGESNE